MLPLLCLPFLLAQLIAPGTMAVGGPDGLRMVLCAGDGPMTVVLTAAGDFVPVDDSDDPHTQSSATCPWSLAFDKTAALGPENPDETITVPVQLAMSWDIDQRPLLSVTQSHPARAPPFSV